MKLINVILRLFKKIILILQLRKKNTVVLSLSIEPNVLKNGIGKNVFLNKKVVCISESAKIGDYTYINGGYIYNAQIGKFCSIGYDVCIGPGEHYLEHVSTYPIVNRVSGITTDDEFVDKKTIVGNDVWIGHGATILGGISIGNGAVIAAGSVVTRDVPPYAVVAGVPAKIIKYRIDKAEIAQMEKIGWWDWPIEKIKENAEDFHLTAREFIDNIGANEV